MKHLFPSTALALFIGLGFASMSTNTFAANSWDNLQPDRDEVIASLNVVELLKRHHYSKPPLDDARSVIIYDSYLKLLDPSRSYFLASDIAEFDKWKTQFDDFLKSGDLQPGFTIYKRYLDRVKARLDFALGELGKGVDKLDFTQKETLLVDRKDAPWLTSTAALDDLWRKRVKDEVLRLKIAGKEPKAIQELLTKRYKNQLARLDQTRAEDIFQAYINTFAMSYDPHTNYLSPDNAENFDINMSLSLEGIGAVLQSDNDQVKIVRLVPAGPADKTKQVAPADKIIGVAQGDKEMVDVVGWRLDEVVKLIRGPKGSVVRLEVIPHTNAPNDQTSKIVSITREAVKLEDQAVQKKVLNLKQDGKDYKLGVIEIPAFYLDFKAFRAGDPDYKSTTRDVKKILTELQKEKVDGVVIDLRNNGGGSLQEATELTSLFIDKGPTVLVRNADGAPDGGGHPGAQHTHFRERTISKNQQRVQHDIDPVRQPQCAHGRGRIACPAKNTVEHPQQQNRQVGGEHQAHIPFPRLCYFGIFGHEQQDILGINKAWYGNQQRQDHSNQDSLSAGNGRRFSPALADPPRHRGRSCSAQTDCNRVDQRQHRLRKPHRRHGLIADSGHEKSIYHGKQRLHHHFQNHRDGQQKNSPVNTACCKILLLAVDGLAQHASPALPAGFQCSFCMHRRRERLRVNPG